MYKRFYTCWAFINIVDNSTAVLEKKCHVRHQNLNEGKCPSEVEVITASALCGLWWWCGLVQLPWRDSGLLLSCLLASLSALFLSSITSLRLWYIHLAVAVWTPWSLQHYTGWSCSGPLAWVCEWHWDQWCVVWCWQAIRHHPLPSVLSFRGQCFMKSIRVYSVISMEIIIIYIIFALHVVLYFLYKSLTR